MRVPLARQGRPSGVDARRGGIAPGRAWRRPRTGRAFASTSPTEKAAEERLQAAEERFRNLVEQMPAITYLDVTAADREAIVWDTAYISPQVEEILGYSPEEWVADPELWRSLLHPDDRERAAEADRAHLEDGTPLDIELRVSTRDGEVRWLRDQAVMILDEEGNASYSQGILLDVTERRLAEQQVREAEERYRAIVEHVPAAIYLDLADRSMRTVVHRARRSRPSPAITPQEWMDDPEAWLRMIVPEDRDQVRARLPARPIADGTAWNAEYRMHTRDGRTIWVHDETTFLHDEDGESDLPAGRADGHHRAQARRAGAARIRAARAGGGRTTPGARRDEEHVPRRRLARAPEPAHLDPGAVDHAGARARHGRRGPRSTCWSGSRPTPASSTVC